MKWQLFCLKIQYQVIDWISDLVNESKDGVICESFSSLVNKPIS